MAVRSAPSGVERGFGDEEIIVSKTDLQGRITYANAVFLRVAAYTEDEVLGQPHNLVRHPDMPRAVFQLAWEVMEAGEEIFAYVLNLAGDGAHYWVLAHMTPTFDASGRPIGYHSSRRTCDPTALRAVQQVYAQLLAEEGRHAGKKEGLAASRALLDQLLADTGLTYDAWVWSLGGAEVAA